MRIDKHPILKFHRGREIEFELDGRGLTGYEGETIAAAIHAAGVRTLRTSIRLGRPRGFFCAIGRCSSCLMTVNGIPNVMTCITPLERGMKIETQTDKGHIAETGSSPRKGPSALAAQRPRGGRRGTADAEEPSRAEEPRARDLGHTPLAVVGGGPAGLSAAIAAGRLGVESVIIDENEAPGGQLIKQTHMFFGSKEHYAKVRGVDIGGRLTSELSELPARLLNNTTVLGLYPDRALSLLRDGRHHRLSADAVVLATGASENMLAFPGCDLPGVYGAGAVQTLMNVDGVVPGARVLMVGAGNIGLIVAYQLLQAGVEVAAVIEGLPTIGGYHVHGAKIRRAGVPIMTAHTILEAEGRGRVEKALVARVDADWRTVPGSETEFDVDTVCLAVGLSPNCELALMGGCEETYVAELGGRVAVHGSDLETSMPGVFIAGDASGIEEASTAMLEGRLAGLAAAERVGEPLDETLLESMRDEAADGLAALRSGPFGDRPRTGKEKMYDLARKLRQRGERREERSVDVQK
ncbi:MAG: FAD-dependent oxidoreductase [Candidatus Eisenbacteria bacterium]|nr:FAD-dependent oxidoreductase [Candidatus Eisenbacteria bacterium]